MIGTIFVQYSDLQVMIFKTPAGLFGNRVRGLKKPGEIRPVTVSNNSSNYYLV